MMYSRLTMSRMGSSRLRASRLNGTAIGGDPGYSFPFGGSGYFYDPSDVSSLWRDELATVPVVAHGDPVRRMDDLSGNGRHAVAPDPGACPLYQTDGTYHWLAVDGVDDIMTMPPAPVVGGAVAVMGLDNSGSSKWQNGTPLMYGLRVGNYYGGGFGQVYTSFASSTRVDAYASVNTKHVSTWRHDGTDVSIDTNRTEVFREFAVLETTPGTAQLFGVLNWEGFFFGAVIFSYIPPAEDVAAAEAYMAEKSGIILP